MPDGESSRSSVATGTSRLLGPAVVVSVWALSRLLFRGVLGISFDAGPLGWFWQYLDPAWLRTDPLGSLWHLHAQPPLFNAFLAAGLALAEDPAPLWNAAFLVVGAALHLAIWGLLRCLGAGCGTAVATAALFALSPSSLLYEAWLFYTWLLAAVLCGAAWALHRTLRPDGRARHALLLFALLGAAVLTRSLFHLAWLVVWVVAVTLSVPRHRRAATAAAAALPLVLCAGLYAKNAALFGSFTGSSWLGLSLCRMAARPVPPEEREALHAAGRISAVALHEPFLTPLDRYPQASRRGAPTGHPVLTSPRKSTGAPNLNHGAYLVLSRTCLDDALHLIAHRPTAYAGSVGDAWLVFAAPPSRYWFLRENGERIAGYEAVWDAAVYGVPESFAGRRSVPTLAVTTAGRAASAGLLLLPVGAVAVLLASSRGVRLARSGDTARATAITLLFLSTTVLFVAVVGNALELGENNRFRFIVEPLIWVAIAWMLDPRARGRHRGGPPRTGTP